MKVLCLLMSGSISAILKIFNKMKIINDDSEIGNPQLESATVYKNNGNDSDAVGKADLSEDEEAV